MSIQKWEELRVLAKAVTPQDFDSAEIVCNGGWIECPSCCGEGNLEIDNDYCNYDSAALGVQFYGIGEEHINAEAYYRAANPVAVLALIGEVAELTKRLEASEGRLHDVAVLCATVEQKLEAAEQKLATASLNAAGLYF